MTNTSKDKNDFIIMTSDFSMNYLSRRLTANAGILKSGRSSQPRRTFTLQKWTPQNRHIIFFSGELTSISGVNPRVGNAGKRKTSIA